MSSQDTMNYAKSEEENAKALDQEINSQQSKVANLQQGIDRANEVISGLQEKQRRHYDDANRLRQQAIDEQQKEQQDQLQKQQENQDGLAKEAAKESISKGLFG